jgi:predicted MFS family arabinose efflux permease
VLITGIRRLVLLDAGPESAAVHWRARLGEAAAYLRDNRPVVVLLLGQAAALIFFALTEPIEVPFTRDTLGAGAGGYGALIAAWGVGVTVGSIVYTWVGWRRLKATVLLATLVQGCAFLGLAASGTIEAACAVAVVGGAANGAQLAAISTAIQEAVAPAFQARVMSFYEAVSTAAPGIGYLIGGALGTLAGGRAAFVVAGLGVFAVVAVVVAARPWRALDIQPTAPPETMPA